MSLEFNNNTLMGQLCPCTEKGNNTKSSITDFIDFKHYRECNGFVCWRAHVDGSRRDGLGGATIVLFWVILQVGIWARFLFCHVWLVSFKSSPTSVLAKWKADIWKRYTNKHPDYARTRTTAGKVDKDVGILATDLQRRIRTGQNRNLDKIWRRNSMSFKCWPNNRNV